MDEARAGNPRRRSEPPVTRIEVRPLDPEPRPAPPRPAREIEQIVLRSSLRVMGALAGVMVVLLLLWRLRLLVLLVVGALFIAALLNPAVGALTRRGLRRVTAVGLVYLALVVLAGGLGYLFFHPVYESATRFARDLPSLVDQAKRGKGVVGHLVSKLHLVNYIKAHAPRLESAITNLGKPAIAVGRTVLSGFVSALTVAVLSFFLLLEGPALFGALLRWLPERRAAVARSVVDAMASQVTGYMLGNFATSIIAGLVVYITLLLTGVPFAIVLALWVAIVDFLPLVGGLLAGVPTVLLAFLHSLPAGIATIVVFLVYQQLENHVLIPLVINRTLRLNPLWVLLAVLVGVEIGGVVGSTFGSLVGALLAIPAAGTLQVTARELVAARRGADEQGG